MTKDWRYDNAKTLRGIKFQRRKYEKWNDSWDHDHCEGCMAKFAEFDGPEILHEGYTTYEGPEQRAGYHWVCLKCFDDLKNELAWTAGAPAGEITQKKVK